ncbi:MAG: hypothetical protein ACFB6R_01825 [Alphaproteobacteria bacterium]
MALALTLAVPAHAQRLSVEAFYGTWKGSAISESEVSVHFHVTARDIGVTLGPAGENRFKLTTATVKRKKGTPDDPIEEVDTREVIFQKGKDNLWWALDSGDPRDGGVLRWARLDDNALIISTFTVRDDGQSEVQAYHRAITDRGMDLIYTRTVDGSLVRTVKGQLVRVR